MKFIIVLILSFLCFSFNTSYFLIETFYAKINHHNIGRWVANMQTPPRIEVDFKNSGDSLFFIGASDCGALDGTLIKIKFQDSTILKLTRISESGILRNDTVMIHPKSTKKQSFMLDHIVSFYATPGTFKNFDKQKIYSIYYERIIDRHPKEVHIFDMELK